MGTILHLALGLVVLVLVQAPAVAQAQIERVTLRVDGLACPFCAYGLEKKIKNLEGCDSLEIRINEGKAIMKWKRDKALDIDAIHDAVRRAGFTLRSIRGTFTGTVARDKEGYVLVLPPPLGQRFLLFEAEAVAPGNGTKEEAVEASLKEGSTAVLSDRTRNLLEEAALRNASVRVIGEVHRHTGNGALLVLGVERLEVVPQVKNEESR